MQIEDFLSKFQSVAPSGDGYIARCPGPSHANGDSNPSLSIGMDNDSGNILLKCHAGCKNEDVVAALGLCMSDLFPDKGNGRKPLINVEMLASDKNLPADFLRKGGVRDMPGGGVEIPYRDETGREEVSRLRYSLSAKKGSRWPKGSSGKIIPYGLPSLKKAREQGFVVFVEGESDTWTLAFHGFPVLGIPGADMTKVLKASHVDGIEKAFLFQEPDKGGETFIEGMSKRLSELCFKGDVRIVKIDGIKDPNELHKKGAEQFKEAFQKALDDSTPLGAEALPVWPEPQSLTAKVDPEPYPLDALPKVIREAVSEVQGFTKAPIPLVASSALGALSLAVQAHTDVKRAEKLTGPSSLFLLTIADSGERKTTCDGFFTKSIREYESAQAELSKPASVKHRADIEVWEAKRGGIKEKIRQLAKDNKPTMDREESLRDLESNMPRSPRAPRLLYADATPEALAYGLAKNWPSGGVVSAEAGIVFGSHGMGKDSVMRNLSLLNVLWDGGNLTIDRRATESFTVRGARLTVALQVQEAALRTFFERTGGLARGTGFLARFLVSWPESTQGFRPFTEPPPNWPALAVFNKRIAAILEQPSSIDEDGALSPPLLPFTVEAKAAWIAFHDAIEGELCSGGELYDVRDVASKAADNAARLAALFQIFEGAAGAIGLEAFEAASRIAAWHLNEARRFFGEFALPAELADAARLDSWLIDYCRVKRTNIVSRRDVQRFVSPTHLRKKEPLENALHELSEAGRVRLIQEGKRKEIHVNPVLLERGAA